MVVSAIFSPSTICHSKQKHPRFIFIINSFTTFATHKHMKGPGGENLSLDVKKTLDSMANNLNPRDSNANA